MALACYNSYLEIDMQILLHNIQSIQSALPDGTQMIPVLKGNAYGFGAVKVARLATSVPGISCFAVAQIGEGIELRQAGIAQNILVLGAFPLFQLPLAVEYGLQLTVFDSNTVKAINTEALRQGKTVGIHIKIETGLNRIGVKPGKALAEFLEILKDCPQLKLEGVFTHFIDGEIKDSPLAHKQFALYMGAVAQIQAAGFDVPLRHICNSGASDWFPQAYLDAVRIGRRLYMDSRDYPLPAGTLGAVDEPASWRTTIMNLHTVQPGESVGYDGIFIAERPTEVATICVGYGDGLYSGFVGAGSQALVRGQLARYIGICMDQSFLDVTDLGCRVGDEVTIFGHSSDGHFLSAQALAKTVGHEGVFFTDTLSQRVEKRYIHEIEV